MSKIEVCPCASLSHPLITCQKKQFNDGAKLTQKGDFQSQEGSMIIRLLVLYTLTPKVTEEVTFSGIAKLLSFSALRGVPDSSSTRLADCTA
jgi:hypothetical protein